MCMRKGGQAFVLAAILAFALALPAAAACDDGTGCDSAAPGLVAAPAMSGAAATEAEPEPVEKPLSLVSRKSSKSRLVQKTSPVKTLADPTATARSKSASAAEDKVKNARAQARESDLGSQDDTLTKTDLFPAPAQASTQPPSTQPSMPVVSPDEVSEIDDAETAPASAPAIVAQPAAPRIMTAVEDKPGLSLARIDGAESTTVASAARQDSAWDKTSLIGKIFIALGGLLTAASAVRMFVG